MSDITCLQFCTDIGKQKPNNIHRSDSDCPFCDREHLTDILEVKGPIIWLKNKFPTLQHSFMTVLIETDDCTGDLSLYSKEHLHDLIRFGVEHWLEMEKSGKYQSVLFFKNYGPYSGGSLRHPHMQIVGLKTADYRKNLKEAFFDGIMIDEKEGVTFNVSTTPKIGFTEFNVMMTSTDQMDQFADYIQMATHYTLHHFFTECNSYNLFFYYWNEKVICKIIPRFITSPLFVGFSISQVSSQIHEVAKHIKQLYID